MQLKVAYVISCGAEKYYLEQAMVSMHSLRMHNKDCHITLITDDITGNRIADQKSRILQYVDEHIIVNTPASCSFKERASFIKTSLRRLVAGNFIYIDSDTIVTDSLEDIKNIEADIAAVYNNHKILKRLPEQQPNTLKLLDIDATPEKPEYFNSGVIYVKDSPVSNHFFDAWHNAYIKSFGEFGIDIDQPSFAKANQECGYIVKELNGIWNCQIYDSRGMEFLENSKIIHYYSSLDSIFDNLILFRDKYFYRYIREAGIGEDIEESIKNARQIWKTLRQYNYNIEYSPLMRGARYLSLKFPRLNGLIYHIMGLFGKY